MDAAGALLTDLAPVLSSDSLDPKLMRIAILNHGTPHGLAEFAQQGPDEDKLLEKLFADEPLMRQILEAGGANGGEYGEAMQVYTAILKASERAREVGSIFQRLALGTSIHMPWLQTETKAVKLDAEAEAGGDVPKLPPLDRKKGGVYGIVYRTETRVAQVPRYLHYEKALLDICQELVKAPDELAALRLEADLLLSQADLAKQGANAEARAKALRPLVDRYVNTPVAAKVLRMTMLMALELGDSRLVTDLQEMIEQRFASDLEMIAFQRDKLGGQVLGAPFCGNFKRSDGKMVRLPMDTLGRSTMLLFWSKENGGEDLLKGIAAAALEKKADLNGRLELISFNLDDLPDAGESFIRSLGVNWQGLNLPGGKKNPIYNAFVREDPRILTVNPTGYTALIMAGTGRTKTQSDGKPDYTQMFQSTLARPWTEPRYVMQVDSLMIGDFLVSDPEGRLNPTLPPELKAYAMGEKPQPLARAATSVPEETLQAIQDSIVAPPLRYRLSHDEARTNYTKAVELCRKAIKDHPEYPMMWTFSSFLLDRYHSYWLFQVPFTAGWTYGRRENYFLSKGDAEEAHRILRTELSTDQGKPLRIPEDLDSEWTAIVFAKPAPWNSNKDDGLPASPKRALKSIADFAATRPAGDVKVLLALLGGDVESARAGLDDPKNPKNKVECPIVTVPGGIESSLMKRLGVLSEDSQLNSVLVNKDGRIAVMLSGLDHREDVILNVIMHEDENAIAAALERGDIQAAKDKILALAPPFDPNAVDAKGRKLPKPPATSLAHLRARARVYMALKDYDAALADAQEVVQRQLGTDGGMSLRTDELDASEQLRDNILELRGKP